MNINAVVAEFNPFHNGHRYILSRAKQNCDGVICVMSGNFVQRGDVAVIPKHLRAKTAIENGADICIELPTPWAMSTAQSFALGSVSIIHRLNAVNGLVFGSECGDINALNQTADIIQNDSFSDRIDKFLKTGMTFAAARQAAVETISKDAALVLSNPNDILATEYFCALKGLGSNIKPYPIKRVGNAHNADTAKDGFMSASKIREYIKGNDFNAIGEFLPNFSIELFENTADILRLENAILAKLRTLKKDDFKDIADISEGIENRLFNAAQTACSLDEFFTLVKTKRYTLSRVRRLTLSAFLELKAQYAKSEPPYARVLGFSKNGEQLLKRISRSSDIPIITRATQIDSLSPFAKEIFEFEVRATDLYGLSLKKPLACGMEYKQKIIKVD